ncbi:MAG: GNAT family N-acetyltransferase [Alphaproteobacteria bacterium]
MEVIHNLEKQTFEIEEDGHRAYLGYKIEGEEILMYTTQVPHELGGKGVGSLLAKTALEFSREKGLKVIPLCSFVSTYIERHKEYQHCL